MSPGKLLEVEQEKLDKISSLSSAMLDLKKRQLSLEKEKSLITQEKCSRLKKLRHDEYKGKANEMDEKERNLCRKTNRLVDEFISTCDETPFHKALVHILENLKGTFTLT